MTKLTRAIAVAAFLMATVFAFTGVANAQSPDYTGVVPTTTDVGAGGLARGDGVAAAPAARAAGALPYTGGDSLPIAQLGVALLAVGAITVLAVRKRNSTTARHA